MRDFLHSSNLLEQLPVFVHDEASRKKRFALGPTCFAATFTIFMNKKRK